MAFCPAHLYWTNVTEFEQTGRCTHAVTAEQT